MAKNAKSIFNEVENILAKRENANYQLCFQKPFCRICRHSIPLTQRYTQPVTCMCSSRTQSIPELVRPCSSTLVLRILLCSFLKLSIPFIGSLDKCHSSAFNALISLGPKNSGFAIKD